MSMDSLMMNLLETYAYQTLVALFVGWLLFRQLKKGRNGNPNGLPLPPGPKGYPLIGSLLDMPMPSNKPWVVYEEWCKTYGDMVYFNVLGQHFLVLGSLQRATDLLEKRSSNYSDRMQSLMLVDLMKCDFLMGSQPYGVWWRKHRKSFQEYFHHNAVSKYLPIQRREVNTFLHHLLVTPDRFVHHIEHTFAATVMKIVYGIDVQDSDDPYISLAEESLKGINEASIPGNFWADFLPILKYVPSWFPGAGFQKKAAYWRGINASLLEKPFRYVQEQLKNGTAAPSVAASLIARLPHEDDPQRPMEEKVGQDVAAVAYIAGAETTASAMQALFLVMALYPEVQKKAQAEIDAVIGPNRLPVFGDRPFLPYINAIVKELMRWHSIAPLGLPHMATDDDEYNGYYIPKGTTLLVNARSILHDPKYFNNPMEYQPERYLKDGKLNPDVLDPDTVAFGFGRRICPGRHLSNNLFYLTVSCLLAVYDIKPPVDDKGTTINLKPEFTSGLVAWPVPFECIIKPRTPAAEALIRHSVQEND